MKSDSASPVASPDASATELGSQLLIEARQLVARGWCHGTYARDDVGRPVLPWDSRASAWSAMGAIARGWFLRRIPELSRACDDPSTEGFLVATCALSNVVHAAPQTWNDRVALSPGQVVRALERASREVERVSAESVAEAREPIRRDVCAD